MYTPRLCPSLKNINLIILWNILTDLYELILYRLRMLYHWNQIRFFVYFKITPTTTTQNESVCKACSLIYIKTGLTFILDIKECDD